MILEGTTMTESIVLCPNIRFHRTLNRSHDFASHIHWCASVKKSVSTKASWACVKNHLMTVGPFELYLRRSHHQFCTTLGTLLLLHLHRTELHSTDGDVKKYRRRPIIHPSTDPLRSQATFFLTADWLPTLPVPAKIVILKAAAAVWSARTNCHPTHLECLHQRGLDGIFH